MQGEAVVFAAQASEFIWTDARDYITGSSEPQRWHPSNRRRSQRRLVTPDLGIQFCRLLPGRVRLVEYGH